ncbi:sigma-70 family RNA polymerase sigma factor [Patescibacteria group bacterium]|nr:sigma-70 family RNA polymerase sigma factor [Patescibacteria group bacterium]
MTRFNGESYSMPAFLKKRYSKLDPYEVERLFLEAKSEDPTVRRAAIEHLALANIGLVISIAKGYVSNGLPLMDLVQEGMIQLITKAIPTFDPSRGTKFSTYTVPALRHTFTRACAEKSYNRPFTIPEHVRYVKHAVATARAEFYKTLGRWPDTDEIFALLQTRESNVIKAISKQEIERIVHTSRMDVLSLTQPAFEDDGPVLEERMLMDFGDQGAECVAINSEELACWSKRLRTVLQSLPERERETIVFRFGLADQVPKKLEAVGKILGVTRERIRQLEWKAIGRMVKKWRIPSESVRNILISLRELGFTVQIQSTKPVPTEIPSTQISSRVLTEHAVALADGKYVVRPARTLAVRLNIDENTAQIAVETCAKEGAFAFVDGCDAIRL